MHETSLNKSLLDNVKVEDKAFPLRLSPPKPAFIVGHCPACGAPIYGPSSVSECETPVVTRSCVCVIKRIG